MNNNENTSIQKLATAIVQNPRLLYEEVLNQDIHTGSITMQLVYPESQKGLTRTIPFIMTNDFTFSLGNEWTTVLPNDITGWLSNITGWYNALTTLSNRDDSQISFQSKLGNTASYVSSKTPQFTVELTFVCTQRDYNPSEIIKTLSAMCLPLKYDTSKAQTMTGITDGTISALSGVKNKLASYFVSDQTTVSEAVNDTIVSKTDANIIRSDIQKPSTNNGSSIGSNSGAKAKEQSNTIKNNVGNIVNNADPSNLGSFDTLVGMGLSSEDNFISSTVSDKISTTLSSLKDLGNKAVDAIKESVMMAPLYYQAVYDESSHNVKINKGTISLSIGKWFKADNLICTEISNIKFSKEVIAPQPKWLGTIRSSSISTLTKNDNNNWGFPLYATCTLTLRPCTIINYEDFCRYFIQSSGNTTATINSVQSYVEDSVKNIL